MAIMSLNTNPQPDIGSGGHVVDSTIQTKDIVVLKTEDSANTENKEPEKTEEKKSLSLDSLDFS